MISKVFLLAAAFIAVNAQDHYSYGQATSSQSIIRHDNSQSHRYNQPIAVSAPVYQSAPLQSALTVQHASPIFSHSAPLISHSAPVISSHSPIISHSSPYITHAAPIAQHAIPTRAYASPVLTLQHGSGLYNQQYAQGHQEYNSYPRYEFSYGVNDPHTGDIKSQHESRDGDRVTGSYSLHEADGSVRTVHYNADAHSGFNAQVQNSQPSRHATPVVSHASPIISHSAPVISHAAPIISHAAPVLTHAAPLYTHVTPISSHSAHSAPIAQYSSYH
ncbi:cuticle protein 18.6-like [Pieris napi]|uniref:cuticle protein 18.6-like n=1 Tax=Pieris napi TaxID=78633 RepID=UPI001FBAB87E|nr:cuticle protein 18.6-like [Pieris napi]